MKTLQKLLCLLLALVCMVCMLAACGGGGEKTPEGSGTEGSNGDAETTPETENLYDSKGYLKDSLPETYNWDEDFNIYTWDDQKNWEWVEDGSEVEGSVMQALVERQTAIEERFNVTIKFTFVHGSWEFRNTFIQTLANNVQNNQKAFDLVGQYTPAAGIGALQGLYLNLNDTPNLDLEKPWWPSSISETITVGDKLYFVTGDITPTLIRNVHCMFINTDMFTSMNLTDLTENRSIYDVVRDGDWTLEMMKTLGIGTVSNAEEMYGITFANNVQADAFFYGAGFSLLKNDNGVLTLSNDLKGLDLYNYFDEMQKLFAGKYSDVKIDSVAATAFIEKRSLFFGGTISDSEKFTKNDIRFTVLPMPKLNEAQLDYRTVSSFWVTMYSIPSDARNEEMSGMILEGLASESYRNLTDEIYYNIFQFRYNADGAADSAEMFDTVSDSVVFDTARFYADELAMFATFRQGVSDTSGSTGSWASVYDPMVDVWTQKIENLYGKVG